MSKHRIVAVFVVLSMFLCAGTSSAGIGIRVTGPATHIGYKDFNDFVDTYNAEYLAASPYKYNNLKWLPEFSGEVIYNALPMLDVGIGAGIILGTSEFSWSAGMESYTRKHKLRSYPFTATAYYRPPWPLGPFKPILYGGAGLFYTNASFSDAYMGIGDDYSYEWEFTKWGFGLHGGAGIEISILPKLSVDIGVKGRWANFTGFEGTDPISGEDVIIGVGTVEEIWGDPPEVHVVPVYGPMSPEFVDEVETLNEAEVNLSGYSIVVGIKVTF